MVVCSVTIRLSSTIHSSPMLRTFFRYASSQSMGSAARAALTHLKGQSDYALINPRDYALNIQTWSVRSILWDNGLINPRKRIPDIFCKDCPKPRKTREKCKKTSIVAKEMAVFVRGWDTSSSCVKKYRKYDTARAVLGHFSRFSNELLTKTAIFWHSSYNQRFRHRQWHNLRPEG